MAYFAELDNNNIVLRVIVVDEKHVEDGISWCENFFNGGIWLQTSYTGAIRKNYAGIGHIYDNELDAFYTPQPYPSWALDSNCHWTSPTLCPDVDPLDNYYYMWDEDSVSWKKYDR
tara:strand:- start:52 stop:399 length:348 start_codon:yes stop_codon:yes gene_type:complete